MAERCALTVVMRFETSLLSTVPRVALHACKTQHACYGLVLSGIAFQDWLTGAKGLCLVPRQHMTASCDCAGSFDIEQQFPRGLAAAYDADICHRYCP